MKAVILAAGKGTRMLPLTKDIPKVLVQVAGKPFLWYVLKLFEKVGIKDIALIVGYKKEQIKEFVEQYGFNVTLIEQGEQKGTGHAVSLATSFVGDDNFIVYLGDGLFTKSDLGSIIHDDALSYIAGKTVSDWQKYGILQEDENGFLIQKIEKPQDFVGDLAWPGFFKTTPELFEELKKISPSARGELEVTDALNLLAKQKKVKVVHLQDNWLDLGNPSDIAKIETFLEEHPSFLS